MIGNDYSIPPREALDMICKICEEEYNKGKRKININRIWNIVNEGLNFEYNTNTIPSNNKGKITNCM